jgi:hypothetical protein
MVELHGQNDGRLLDQVGDQFAVMTADFAERA